MGRASAMLILMVSVLLAATQAGGVSVSGLLSNLGAAIALPDADSRNQFCRWAQTGEWKLQEPSQSPHPTWRRTGQWKVVCDPQGGPLP